MPSPSTARQAPLTAASRYAIVYTNSRPKRVARLSAYGAGWPAVRLVQAGLPPLELYGKEGYYLGIGIFNLFNLFDREAIVLGGGVPSAVDRMHAAGFANHALDAIEQGIHGKYVVYSNGAYGYRGLGGAKLKKNLTITAFCRF